MEQSDLPLATDHQYRSGIYEIVNTANGKRYVGRAKHFPDRWKQHRYTLNKGTHANRWLQFAWNKYGADVFVFRILEEVPLDEHLLEAREEYWCERLTPEYNLKRVGGTILGRTMTTETRAKLSAKQKGRQPWLGKKHSAETRAKIGKAHLGRQRPPISEETREKYRQAGRRRTGWKHTEEAREKVRLARLGTKRTTPHVVSEETRAKISAAKKGKAPQLTESSWEKIRAANAARKGVPMSEENRAKLSAAWAARRGQPTAQRGRHLSDERKAHLSAINTGKKRGPRTAETRAKLAEKAKGNTNWLGKKHTPEQLAKMSAAAKARAARRRAEREASSNPDTFQQITLFPS